ncbi:hypothetical protein, partial [Pseudomonas oleovorans]|uniref:hypothetical protein n=1 Tax=Ectopseudomonas oleovorans TaxID=301 RepID=UPI0028F0CB9C
MEVSLIHHRVPVHVVICRRSKAKVRIPRSSGHLFHEHLAIDSTLIRPLIPRPSGHPIGQAATQDSFTTIDLFFEAERSSWSVY